jgi:hypothetical protein
MTVSCTSTPISWTRLELYAAGEGSEVARVEIATHLDACDACKRCLAMIEADSRPLVPLELPAAKPAKNVFSLRRAMPAAGALALAAALFLFLRPVGRTGDLSGGTPGEARSKGALVGFVLVRDDNVELTDADGTYRDGERFKARISCPAEMHASWDVVVRDNGETSFPLEPQADLPCGNGVVLPGAFRLVGHNPMTVCVVHREGGLVDRDEWRRNDRAGTRDAVCKSLRPAP